MARDTNCTPTRNAARVPERVVIKALRVGPGKASACGRPARARNLWWAKNANEGKRRTEPGAGSLSRRDGAACLQP
eukprot:11090996-Alexandrium_andersonii.AAC.1